MSKKFFTTESLATLVNEIKNYVANAILTKADSSHSHTITDVDSLQDTLNAKATQNSLDSHVSDTSKHITEDERTNWNAAKTHADSAHVTSVNGMSGDVVIDIPTDYITTIPEEYVTEDELAAKGYLTSFTETDPTVPAWAKSSTKPTYTKSEVGLGNVDNVKQYSANNPPPYPVTSVNGVTGAVTVKAVPNCSTSNNGQFLRVINGVAAWSTVPNAEEATF